MSGIAYFSKLAFPIPTSTSALPTCFLPSATATSTPVDGSDPFLKRSASDAEIIAFPRVAFQSIATRLAEQPTIDPNNIYIHRADAHHLRNVNQLMTRAREALKTRNFAEAGTRYRDALRLLETPFHPTSDRRITPFHQYIYRGNEAYREALFGAAAYADSQHALESISRLTPFIRDLQHHIDSETPDPDTKVFLGKAQLLRANALLRHTLSATEPQETLLTRIVSMIDTARESIEDGQGPAYSEARVLAGLLMIETLSRQLAIAHASRRYTDRDELVERIRMHFRQVSDDIEGNEANAVIAEYRADVATLFARLGLWGPALENARTVTAKPYDDTPAAARLLNEELFKPFVDGERFLSAGELRLRARKGAWRKRFQAALEHAHSEGLKQAATFGALGMFAGIAADAVMHGGHQVIAGAAGAALAMTINRLRNGWKTQEARYANEIGTYDRDCSESAKDAGKLMFQGGLDTLLWLAPTAALHSGTDGLTIFSDTFMRAMNLYGKFGMWIGDGVYSGASHVGHWMTQGTFDHDMHAIGDGLVNGVKKLTAVDHRWLMFYHLYSKSAGVLFATQLLFPKARKYTDPLAFWMLPGAMMLSADIGMVISGKSPIDFVPHFGHPDYLSRVERVSIVAAETALMMLTSGVLALEKKSFKAVGNALNPLKVPYTLPLAAIITNGITSPLGGMMQKGPHLTSSADLMIQGAAITIGILPFTLALSGVLKGNIPLGASTKEAWEDSAGLPLHQRLWESTVGFWSAFNMPYAHNRIGRSFTLDLIPAGMRSALGWDTNPGQIAMSSINWVSGNGTATSTWPETGGTRWERESIKRLTRTLAEKFANIEERVRDGELKASEAAGLKLEALGQIRDFFSKAGQRMHPMHIFMDHDSERDRLWILHSITRFAKPPTYAHVPQPFLFGNVHQMLEDGHHEKLTDDEFEGILAYVQNDAKNPDAYDIVKPLVKTLAMARDSERFGERIRRFFAEESWIQDAVDVDIDNLPAVNDRSRRANRATVRQHVTVPFSDYERRAKGHHRVPRIMPQFEGLFTSNDSDPTATPTSRIEALSQRRTTP